MKIVQCKQGSQTWFTARCGRITGSEIINVLAFRKDGKGELAKRADYRAQLIAERLTGQMSESFVSEYMKRGTEEEPFAREEYAIATDSDVEQVGFVIHPAMDYAGASPDGLIAPDGVLELKNPGTRTHLEYLAAGVLPEEYEPQVMFEIDCTERDWCDFQSRDSRLPGKLKTFTIRVHRDEQRLNVIRDAVRLFNQEVEDAIGALQAKYGPFVIPAQTVAKVAEAPDDADAWLTDEYLERLPK